MKNIFLTLFCMNALAEGESHMSFNHNIFKEDSKKTAIILIEFQKTWTEKGLFYNLIKNEYETRNVLSNTISLLKAVRDNDITVIHAPLIIDKNNKEQYKKIAFLPKILNRFTKDTWKAEFTDGVYQSKDKVVTGRTAFDATVNSNLEEILKKGGYKYLLFCGFTTDHCVSETMGALIKKQYNCILVSDCTATSGKKKQNDIEKKYNFMSSSDIIKILEN